MKKIFLILFFLSFRYIVFAAFENQIYSSKQASFSNCGVSYKGESFVFINPAVVSYLNYKSLSFAYNSMFQGLEEEIFKNSFLISYPFKSFGFSLAGDILTLKDIYREDVYLLNFSKNGYGLNLKILSNNYLWSDGYTEGDKVLKEKKKTGYTLDLGILKDFRNFDCGVSILNILPVDIGRKTKDLIPMTLKTGLTYRRKNINFLIEFDYKNLSYLSSGRFDYSFAIDFWPYQNFSFSAGLSKNYKALGFSFRKFLNKELSSTFLIDYAYLVPSKMTDFSSHYINITYRWH